MEGLDQSQGLENRKTRKRVIAETARLQLPLYLSALRVLGISGNLTKDSPMKEIIEAAQVVGLRIGSLPGSYGFNYMEIMPETGIPAILSHLFEVHDIGDNGLLDLRLTRDSLSPEMMIVGLPIWSWDLKVMIKGLVMPKNIPLTYTPEQSIPLDSWTNWVMPED